MALTTRLVPAVLLILGFGMPAAAQNYTVNTSVDLVTSIDSDPQATRNLGLSSGRLANIQSGFPSLQMRATGQENAFAFKYDYGYIQIHSDASLHSESHSGQMDFSTKLSRHLTMRFSGTYFRSPDLTAFNFFRGVIGSLTNVYGDSGIVSLRRKTTATTALAAFDYSSGPRSTWTVGVGGYAHKYEETTIGTERLSNVNQLLATVDYKHKTSERSSWFVSYSASQYKLKEAADSNLMDHNMSLGFMHQLSPTAVVSVSAGPAYTKGISADWQHTGYNASAGISKTIGVNRIALAYRRRNGSAVGVGVSDIQTVTFDYVRHIQRRTVFSNSYSVYDSNQMSSSLARIKGATGAANLSYTISKNVAVSIAGQYERQKGIGVLEENRGLVMFSLKLSAPGILKGGK